jgi:hypothetical protein
MIRRFFLWLRRVSAPNNRHPVETYTLASAVNHPGARHQRSQARRR